jgi:hypothetical protein
MRPTCPLLPAYSSYLTLKPYTCQLFEPYASFLCRLLLIHRDLPRIILSSPQILPLLCSEVPRISPTMAHILAIVLSTLLALAIVVSATRSFEETEYINMVISPFSSSHMHQHQQRLHRPTPPPEPEQQQQEVIVSECCVVEAQKPNPIAPPSLLASGALSIPGLDRFFTIFLGVRGFSVITCKKWLPFLPVSLLQPRSHTYPRCRC